MFIVAISLGALGGCANFRAVSAFATQTSAMTGLVRDEFVELDTLCRSQAELSIVLNNITDEAPLRDCESFKASQGRLAAVTLDVLDDYANTLSALANNKSFDMTLDAGAVRSRTLRLKGEGGKAVAGNAELTALRRLVETLADIQTQGDRKAAVQRLIDETPNLALTGKILRSFFVQDGPAAGAPSSAPYANLVGLSLEALNSSERMLRSKAFQTAEPIRTMELLRTLRTQKMLLLQRSGTAPDRIPVAIASAIDAWLEALDRFSTDAFKPDARQLMDQLKVLRARARDAKAALQSPDQ